MSIPTDALSLIQQSGQALHNANIALEQSVQSQRTIVLENLLAKDGEAAYKKLQTLAKLTQQMATVEESLKAMYTTAAALSGVKLNLPASKSGSGKMKGATPSKTAAGLAIDVIPVKPARKPRAKKIQTRENLSKNGKKVLAFFETALKKEEFTPYTLFAIAQGAGIAPGSVPESLAKVLLTGAVVMGEKGTYKLG